MNDCILKKQFVCLTVCLATSVILNLAGVSAAVIHVPSQYPTIQAGIDAAVNGDTVLVADGVYTGPGNHNVNFNGKAITVTSDNGPEHTIIQCSGNSRGFTFVNGETHSSVLRGFTIRDGMRQFDDGGGILVRNSSPIITECIFENNTTHFFGGGIHLNNSQAIVSHCRFVGNVAVNPDPDLGAEGGGADVFEGGPIIFFNCLFMDNTAKSFGGGLNMDYAEVVVINSTFIDNDCPIGGGISARSSDITVTNSIVWGNQDEEVSFLIGDPQITYTCIQKANPWPGDGNINDNPLITTGPWGTGYLSSMDAGQDNDSPCINAGSELASELCSGNPEVCLDTLTTFTNHAPDTGIVNIGYHFPFETPVPTPTPTATPVPTSAPTSTPTPEPPPCLNHGDVNLDGEITASDAQMAFQIVLGTIVPTYEQECAADCNGDGIVTASDAQLIFLTVLGTETCADEL
jgi:hypothetical protein